MTGPKGNGEFCSPENLIEILAKQYSLVPKGPVIKWFVIEQINWVKPVDLFTNYVKQRSTFRG